MVLGHQEEGREGRGIRLKDRPRSESRKERRWSKDRQSLEDRRGDTGLQGF